MFVFRMLFNVVKQCYSWFCWRSHTLVWDFLNMVQHMYLFTCKT